MSFNKRLNNIGDIEKTTKIGDYTIEYVQLNYKHEWYVYNEEHTESEFFKSYCDALRYVADNLNYIY